MKKGTVLFRTMLGLSLAGIVLLASCSQSLVLPAYSFTTPEQYRTMKPVAGLTIEGAGSDGAFVDDRTVTLSAFQIASYQTTYELWYEVKAWGEQHGFVFSNDGRVGKEGTEGLTPGDDKLQPVTFITWRDLIVWCNAYSAMSNLTPAYYKDAAYTKQVTWLSNDNVFMKLDADGYRMPTVAEWECAARGGDPTNATWGYLYSGGDTLDDVAWSTTNSDNTTHEVGLKEANTAGLYDMSGNVWEYCFDWYSATEDTGSFFNPIGISSSSGGLKTLCGGQFNNKEKECRTTGRKSFSSGNGAYGHGFRVVTSIL